MDSESLLEYDKMMTVVIYICVWLLSIVVLNTFSIKSNTSSNKKYLENKRAIEKIDSQLTKLNKIVEEYYSTTYDSVGESVGVNQLKKQFYETLINTIDSYESAETIRFDITITPFPMGDVIVSLMLLMIMTSIIVITNLINNPFSKLKMMSRLATLQKQMTSTTVQSGGESLSAPPALSTTGISSQTNDIDSRAIFNKMTFSFSVLCITIYICVQLLTASLQKQKASKEGTLRRG